MYVILEKCTIKNMLYRFLFPMTYLYVSFNKSPSLVLRTPHSMKQIYSEPPNMNSYLFFLFTFQVSNVGVKTSKPIVSLSIQ